MLNHKAFYPNFYHGLHTSIKDNITIIGCISAYGALIRQAISSDQRRYQCYLKFKFESIPSSLNTENKPRRPQICMSIICPRPIYSISILNIASLSHSEEEKDHHKRLNLCIYCINLKHSVNNCSSIAANVTLLSL